MLECLGLDHVQEALYLTLLERRSATPAQLARRHPEIAREQVEGALAVLEARGWLRPGPARRAATWPCRPTSPCRAGCRPRLAAYAPRRVPWPSSPIATGRPRPGGGPRRP